MSAKFFKHCKRVARSIDGVLERLEEDGALQAIAGTNPSFFGEFFEELVKSMADSFSLRMDGKSRVDMAECVVDTVAETSATYNTYMELSDSSGRAAHEGLLSRYAQKKESEWHRILDEDSWTNPQGKTMAYRKKSRTLTGKKRRDKKKRRALTAKKRRALPSSDFGLPEQRKYPIYDRTHGANALARAKLELNAGNLTDDEYDRIVDKVCERYPDFPTCERRNPIDGTSLGALAVGAAAVWYFFFRKKT
jgi:hypothetical protein